MIIICVSSSVSCLFMSVLCHHGIWVIKVIVLFMRWLQRHFINSPLPSRGLLNYVLLPGQIRRPGKQAVSVLILGNRVTGVFW